MNKFESASILAGMSPNEEPQVSEPTNLHVITGEVVANSENGTVLVSMDGLVFSEDDTQYIEMDTIGGLEEGDEATIILAGEAGSSMTPLAIGSTGSVDRLSARVIETELLLADKADIEDLEAATARIGDLEADHVSVNTLEAATARIETLEVDHVSISDFEVEQANIDNLQAATADIDTIRANSAKVQNLTAAQLEADHATIGTLDTTYMHANMSNSDVAWIQNGTIKDGAITNAMINSVSANKLTAGTIDASNITVTNLNADNITTGTINGQRIGQGSLSLDKLSENVYNESEVNDIVDDLNNRIDAQIETWTESHVPTLNNTPASAWTTNDLKAEHVGDICYVLNAGNDYDGYTYRFAYDNSTSSYKWVLIKDNQVTAALGRLTTAEGKIEGLESFESTTSSWITQTDEDLTSVKSRTSTLEGSVQVAQTYYATCATAAGTAAKVATITPAVTDFTLRTGTTVIVNFSATNSNSSATLNLNSTGAKSIMYKDAALTSTTRGYLAANRLVILKYDGTYWQITGATTDANTYDRTAYKASLTATAAIPAGTVGVIDANGKITALSTTPFDTSGPILYIGTAYTSRALTQTNNYSMYGTPFNLTTTKSGFTGTAGKPVYIVGTLNGRMFTPDSQIFTTTVPTQADGKQYILLGLMSTATNATLAAEHPIFAYGPNGFAAMDYNNQQALSTKVETSTFNTLSQTVESNTASITSLTTIAENNGLTSSTNITNTVNTVSQTASGNSAKITQLTTTLGTNADGTTKAGDVVHRTSAVEQDLNGFKTTVSQTYATNTRVSTAESNITQNANNIALKVSESDVTGNYVVGKINLDSTTASIAAQHINLQGAVTISDLATDASTALADAAETATSYVTEVTGQNGIMVHPSTDDDTGVRITSDVDIRQDNVSIANFGALDSSNNPTARVGKADSYHVSIDTDSLDVMNATTTLASFGSEVYIGPTNSDHILIGTMTNGNKGLSLRNISGSELEITSREFFSPWSTIPFTFNMQGTNQLVEFTGNGIEIYALGDPVESNYAKAVLKLNAKIAAANQVGSFTFQTNAGSNTWSTPAGTVLWSGAWHMTSGHTANLKYNVSTCPTGIVLHFQPYTSSTVKNYNHIYHFVPKTHVASYNGTGIVVRLGNPDFSNMASKYLYISNDHITGNDQNNTTGTNSGITYNNAAWVMTQVIAV